MMFFVNASPASNIAILGIYLKFQWVRPPWVSNSHLFPKNPELNHLSHVLETLSTALI